MAEHMPADELYRRIAAEMAEHPDRRPVAERWEDLGRPVLCLRPGADVPTHQDMDAVELFTRFLAAKKKEVADG